MFLTKYLHLKPLMKFGQNYIGSMTTQAMSVRKKHCLALHDYNSFRIKQNKLVKDVYSWLNLTINELYSIFISKLGDTNIMRKILSMLPQHKYTSIIIILHNMEDLITMTPGVVVGKLVAHEMSWKMAQEEATSPSKRNFSHMRRA